MRKIQQYMDAQDGITIQAGSEGDDSYLVSDDSMSMIGKWLPDHWKLVVTQIDLQSMQVTGIDLGERKLREDDDGEDITEGYQCTRHDDGRWQVHADNMPSHVKARISPVQYFTTEELWRLFQFITTGKEI